MLRSRRRFALFAPLLALAIAARLSGTPSARAEGEDPADHYNRFLMALADAAMPEGWTLIADAKGAAERQVLADAIAETAKEAKLEPRDVEPLLQSIECPEGKIATVVLVDATTKTGDFSAALKKRAEAAKWGFRELGSNRRLLLASAPEGLLDSVVAVQTKYAARMLARKAQAQLDSHFQHVARPLAEAAVSIEAGAALAHSVLGLLNLDGVQASTGAAGYDPAVAQLRLATDEKAVLPLTDREMAEARGTLGQVLLLQSLPAADAEAKDILKKAVQSEALLDPAVAGGNRYNLACAYGRLKEIEPAFEHLKAVLDQDEKTPMGGISHWRKDPDLDSLHADPRWAEFDKKYPTRTASAGN